MSSYDDGVDAGARITIEWLLKSIKEHNFNIDNVKSILQTRLDELDNQYEAGAKADHFSEGQFNE